jgi:hypothetical protein
MSTAPNDPGVSVACPHMARMDGRAITPASGRVGFARLPGVQSLPDRKVTGWAAGQTCRTRRGARNPEKPGKTRRNGVTAAIPAGFGAVGSTRSRCRDTETRWQRSYFEGRANGAGPKTQMRGSRRPATRAYSA